MSPGVLCLQAIFQKKTSSWERSHNSGILKSFRRSLHYAFSYDFELIQADLAVESLLRFSICYHEHVSVICEVRLFAVQPVEHTYERNRGNEQNGRNHTSLRQSNLCSEEFAVLVSNLYARLFLECLRSA